MQDYSNLLRLDFLLFEEKPKPNNYKEKDSFVTRSAKLYDNLYSYEKVDYTAAYNPVTIVCQEHGDFTATPSNHLTGYYGCPVCKEERRIAKLMKQREEYHHAFVSQSNFRYQGEYTYEAVDYIDAFTRVIITCPEHGDFTQTPNAHLHQNCGCPACAELKQQAKKEARRKAIAERRSNKSSKSSSEPIKLQDI